MFINAGAFGPRYYKLCEAISIIMNDTTMIIKTKQLLYYYIAIII